MKIEKRVKFMNQSYDFIFDNGQYIVTRLEDKYKYSGCGYTPSIKSVKQILLDMNGIECSVEEYEMLMLWDGIWD